MARVIFAPSVQRHVSAPPRQVAGPTVREALDEAMLAEPALRGYVLDDQSALRKHMNVFINGEMIHDRSRLSDPVSQGSEIYVMQALSGG